MAADAFRIENGTRGAMLAETAHRAGGFFARGRGLMLTRELPDGSALVIEPCNSIHMFFMRYPLDVIFLDKSGAVVFMYRGIKPWRMGRIVRGAHTAIELPVGVVERSGTEVGDTIYF